MKKFMLICFLVSSLSSLCLAQPKMKEVFSEIPDSLLYYLTQNNRLDFIDFIESNMKAEVHNELGGKSQMTRLTDESLALQVSPALHVAMQLMPVSEAVDSCQHVICMISTYGKAAPESTVSVYSVKWRPLATSDFLSLPQEPYTAEFMQLPSLGLVLRQDNKLDPIAHEEQKTEEPWLKNVQWKQ